MMHFKWMDERLIIEQHIRGVFIFDSVNVFLRFSWNYPKQNILSSKNTRVIVTWVVRVSVTIAICHKIIHTAIFFTGLHDPASMVS